MPIFMIVYVLFQFLTNQQAAKTIQRESVLSLYRGIVAPLFSVTPVYALSFLAYSVGRKLFSVNQDLLSQPEHKHNTLFRIFLAGSCSGFFTAPVLAPTERLKCMLQTPEYAKKFSGPLALGKHLFHTEGITSVYRGYAATNLFDSVASATYFATYAWAKANIAPLRGASNKDSALNTVLCGGAAGMASWLPSLPIDTLKSRYQTAPNGKYPKGIRSVALELFAQEGIRGIKTLYRGFDAVLIRSFPANGACFLGYETAKQALTGS